MPRVLLHSGFSFFVRSRKRSCAFRKYVQNASKIRANCPVS
nr:MAG TPA: hypothetical protein [Caudoviricetes sp.]